MENQPTSEGQKLKWELMKVVDDVHQSSSEDPEKRYSRDRQKQIEAIDKLPEDLLEEIHAEFMSTEIHENNKVRSILFEEIAKSENEIPNDPLAEGILELLRGGKRYGLPSKTVRRLNETKTPDNAYLRINKKGNIIIEAFGEAKGGKGMGKRVFGQFFKSGFRKSVLTLNSLIKDIDFSKIPELSDLQDSQVVLSPNFVQYLHVTAEKDPKILKEEFKRKNLSLLNKNEVEKSQSKPDVVLVRSCFGLKEMDALTKHLIKKLGEKL
jgi:hypothetical protein